MKQSKTRYNKQKHFKIDNKIILFGKIDEYELHRQLYMIETQQKKVR